MPQRWRRSVVFVLALALIFPQAAAALTVRAPRHVLRKGTFSVKTASTDPTGTALLIVDGTAVRSSPALPSSVVTFTGVPLQLGTRWVNVGLRTRDGVSVTTPTAVSSWTEPLPPILVSPAGYSAGRSPVLVRAGGWTTSLKLIVDGKTIKTLSVKPNSLVSFGTVSFTKSPSKVTIVAANPVAKGSYGFTVKRLAFPWATCIIVDKSDFKLYWVKNGVLVKTYPIAHGKPNTPTPSSVWRVGAKYYTDPNGIYGPRKMRLYRKSGSTFEYTRFLIHGTNEPWVIGTRASHGCIRMYNSDVLELFPQVEIGTMVQTRD